MKWSFVKSALIVALVAQSSDAQESGSRTTRGRESAKAEPRSPVSPGRIEHYVSKMDGKRRPYATCQTGSDAQPRPLIVEVSPGGTDLARGVRMAEGIAAIAHRLGHACVVVRPTGRGPGSVNQNYGEVDTMEAIADAVDKFNVDRDRISVTGSSMGGAATWYLTSHNPDFFAAGAPFCGYCDYRLWRKPGGYTFHMHPWEEPSWQARSAALLIENFEHTPMWIVHGEWDRSVGGGVSVEQSRQMARLFAEKGFAHTYTEVPKTGHGCRTPEVWNDVIAWLLTQRKRRSPDHVGLTTYELRHSRSYWASIEQFDEYSKPAKLDVHRTDDQTVTVTSHNVRIFRLGPLSNAGSCRLEINKQNISNLDLTVAQMLRRDGDGVWRHGDVDLSSEKHPGCSGPISDLFHENTILVPGTAGTDEESFMLAMVAGNARWYFRQRNGGVHRGGIMGENNVDLSVRTDTALTDSARQENNLLLYGNYGTNATLKRFRDQLPVSFGEESITVGGKTFRGRDVAVFAVFPHPEHADRYVAVHGGVTPDAVTWGSHLDMQLLPDYVVYDRNTLLGWGFWNNQWRANR